MPTLNLTGENTMSNSNKELGVISKFWLMISNTMDMGLDVTEAGKEASGALRKTAQQWSTSIDANLIESLESNIERFQGILATNPSEDVASLVQAQLNTAIQQAASMKKS